MKGFFVVLVLAIVCCASLEAANSLTCTRPHEHFACGSACQTRCDNIGKVCPIVNIRCNDACYCNDGYARKTDDKSTCIPQDQC